MSATAQVLEIMPPDASDERVSSEPSPFALSLQLSGDQLEHLIAAVSHVVIASLEDRPEYLTTEETAAYLGWPKKRIDNLCTQGRIPFRSNGPGGTRTFVRQDIDQWYQQLHGVSVQEALLAA